MANILVTTIYSTDSIVLAITKFSIDRVYLLAEEHRDDIQRNAVETLKKTYSSVVEIKEKKIPLYDIVKITEKCIELIDAFSAKDKVYINITPSRKTQAIGLLYAAYRRPSLVHKVIYAPDEKKEIITLPLLDFSLSESQQRVLETIREDSSIAGLAEKVGQSRAMLYRHIKELKTKGLLEDSDGFKVTDAGRIAVM